MKEPVTTRRNFIEGGALAAGAVLAGCATVPREDDVGMDATLDRWQAETDLVKPAAYNAYRYDGKGTQGLASLEKLDAGFEKAFSEIRSTAVTTDAPAIWQIYNMGFVVKTREALFSIDLNHRRELELAPLLDFALITHNHDDHYSQAFYRAMNGAGKTVVNNFIDNYGAADWKKWAPNGGWYARGGYTRAEKTFRIKDVEIRTSLTDHNDYLVDYTTAFEIRVGKFHFLHSGDCKNYRKLNPVWGPLDLWLVFPGCGLDVAAAEEKLRPRQMAFGHLWELAHGQGRLTAPMVKAARKRVIEAGGAVPKIPLWGERVI